MLFETLGKSRSSTTLAGITLALGIGANTAMFSVVRASFLKLLPFPNEERLVMVWQSSAERGVLREFVSPTNFVDWDTRNTIFEALGTWPASSLLFGVGSTDPVTLLIACGLFGGAAAAASYFPARGAAAIDPSVAARSE